MRARLFQICTYNKYGCMTSIAGVVVDRYGQHGTKWDQGAS